MNKLTLAFGVVLLAFVCYSMAAPDWQQEQQRNRDEQERQRQRDEEQRRNGQNGGNWQQNQRRSDCRGGDVHCEWTGGSEGERRWDANQNRYSVWRNNQWEWEQQQQQQPQWPNWG